MTHVTTVVINWRRPHNISQVIRCLHEQTHRPKIILWNNNNLYQFAKEFPSAASYCDTIIDSDENFDCDAWASVLLLAKTKYVSKLDDDLLLTSEDVIAECFDYMNTQPWDRIMGCCGFSLEPDKVYGEGGYNLCNEPPEEDTFVDIVKGRFWFMHYKALMMAPGGALGHHGDITLPGFLANGRKDHHVLPGFMYGSTKNLQEGSEAISARPHHYQEREQLRRMWFDY